MRPIDSRVAALPARSAPATQHPRAYPTRALWRCPSFGKTGTRDYIPLFRMRAHSFPGENDSAVSFQSGQHKSRVVLRSAYKIADKAGIRYDHPATPASSGLGVQIV